MLSNYSCDIGNKYGIKNGVFKSKYVPYYRNLQVVFTIRNETDWSS